MIDVVDRAYMPSQLLERLRKFLDQTTVLTPVMNAESAARHMPLAANNAVPQWTLDVNGNRAWGGPMASVHTIMIHETTGWPSLQSADNFKEKYLCLVATARGIGPQYYVDANGTAFALIGDRDLSPAPRITWHGGVVNTTSIGIENGDVGDWNPNDGPDTLRPAANSQGPYWRRMAQGNPLPASDQPGLLTYALIHAQDVNLVWFCVPTTGQTLPNYPGSGDTDQIATRYTRWRNMLFTERDYRSLALLCRLLTEQYQLPRNFPTLPYAKFDSDHANATIFKTLIRTDERRDMQARKLNLTVPSVENGTFPYAAAMWNQYFHNNPPYRGFLSHGISGGHDACPGPLFDWHRFAREVWDWWWYPFDDSAPNMTSNEVAAPRRAYARARGNTRLQDYYFDNWLPTPPPNVPRPGFPAQATDFTLLPSTQIYAMANGVIVAAELSNDASNPGFILMRHEVFHVGQQFSAEPDRIDYDSAPTIVWSLTSNLRVPNVDWVNISLDNPDWLNRILMRVTECELGVAFQQRNASDAGIQTAWSHISSSEGDQDPATGRPRNGALSSGAKIERDATEYRRIVTALQAGAVVLFPLEMTVNPTSVRVLLGDFLGTTTPPGFVPATDIVRVQIFSKDRLPVPNQAFVVPTALTVAAEAWWRDVSDPIRFDESLEKSLPPNGVAWQYNVSDFLGWINAITWKSEWPKYGVVDAQGAAVARPATPRSRIV